MPGAGFFLQVTFQGQLVTPLKKHKGHEEPSADFGLRIADFGLRIADFGSAIPDPRSAIPDPRSNALSGIFVFGPSLNCAARGPQLCLNALLGIFVFGRTLLTAGRAINA